MAESKHDVIVMGGGPAGSTAAALLALNGRDVLLLEADAHPRAHVGESLLPGVIPILDAMGALEAIEQGGFGYKTGSTHWGWGETPSWDLWFSETELYDHAWLVERARFDEVLFRRAEQAGADAREHAAVKELLWENDRLTGVRWRRRGEEHTHEARARFVIDATGRASLVARQLELRETIRGLQHQALWAHFDDTGRLPSPREHQALFSAQTQHWMWFFPFPEGRASVGMIHLAESIEGSPEAVFDEAIRSDARFSEVLGPSARRTTPVRSVRDWSYRMSRVHGPGWLLAGDASGFVDPVLSTGVFLAMHAGHQVARTLEAIFDGSDDESEAFERYASRHRALFEDMLRIVRFFYKQTLQKDDYFWKAKDILLDEQPDLKPQKAFLVLTSGLVKNLALEETQTKILERRGNAVEQGAALDGEPPEQLGFVGVHLRYTAVDPPAPMYFLMERRDPAAPSLFRTKNLDLNCLAPRFSNDPISVPELAGPLRSLERLVGRLDDVPDEALASFWRRRRGELVQGFAELPPSIEIVRFFGE